jgi:hypothetical protein
MQQLELSLETGPTKTHMYRMAEKSPYTDQYGPNPAVSFFVVEPY